MSRPLAYCRPGSLVEALDFLAEQGEDATLLAGGTDVMVDLRAGTLKTGCLLDVSRLSELRCLENSGRQIRLGAAVTISEIAASELLKRDAPIFPKAANGFASRQIRNVATVGGNVAHCSPCGDMVPPLLVHEATAVLVSRRGERVLPVAEIAAAPYRNALRSDELITHFLLEPSRAEFNGFQKIGRRQALAIARLSLAVLASQDRASRIRHIRIALGSGTPTPRRMFEIEAVLTGRKPSPHLIWEAGERLAKQMVEITGRRDSTTYKEKAAQGLLLRLLCPLMTP